MSITHTITQKLEEDGINLIEKSVSVSGGRKQEIDVNIPDSTTDDEVAFTADVSLMQAIYMVSDQDVTIETNDGSSPDDTYSLTANVPIAWYTGSGLTNPVTTDITTNIFITNASGSTARVRIWSLETATP